MTQRQNILREPIGQDHGATRLPSLHVWAAAAIGLALRLFFALRFPAPAGDSAIYLQLARNWADHRVYGLWVSGQLIPTDLRVPGYPAFLAFVASIFGRSERAIVLSQAVVDLGTCFLTALLAAALIPTVVSEVIRRRVATAGIWLAATCPLLANYCAVVLTETLVTFLGTAALICFVCSVMQDGRTVPSRRLKISNAGFACLGAFLTGVASLVRPEMPLLLIAGGAVFALRWWKRRGAGGVMLAGICMAAAFLAPLTPWAVRNFFNLREVQISAPRYATMPGEYAPVGYFAWTKTWLTRYRDVYTALWPVGDDPIPDGDIPASAFDSPQEKQRIAALLEQYNSDPNLDITPALDHEFGEIARQRTARNPWRTYLWVPASRTLTLWFTPRTELLPISAKLWPFAANWDEAPAEYLVALFFAVLGYLYIALAQAGIWRAWGATGAGISQAPNYWGIVLVITYLVIRTAFLTTVEAPEPRYIIPCYPAVLALGVLLWQRRQE